MAEMTIRKMAFEFTPEMQRVFIKNDPAMSYTFLGAWMMLPYLEPYLIRTMRQALPHVQDPQLRDDLRMFCAQEGEHYKQHARANDIIRSVNPGFAGLSALEEELDAEYKGFSKDKPLLFNLAYAEGFESMTSAASTVQLEMGMYDRVDSPLAHLGKWHVMEELEHRSVAFDVYHACGGTYLYRLKNQLWAQGHYFKWVKRFADLMREADPELFATYDKPEIARERKRWNRRYWRRAIPQILKTYRPRYTPRELPLTAEFTAAQQRYSGMAKGFGRIKGETV
ncbi:metal-dependent hydrolase [Sphingomonas arenae]|uniref:metal-dependent hydrolase n=1 Tax=Sphingomonas arenae TaxID=2812555 RepID=UPI0019675859|nr:metal-dependent hydrolase [Sphingomonas arenae]